MDVYFHDYNLQPSVRLGSLPIELPEFVHSVEICARPGYTKLIRIGRRGADEYGVRRFDSELHMRAAIFLILGMLIAAHWLNPLITALARHFGEVLM